MATTTLIPIIDFVQISKAPDTAAQDLLQACADWGFFYVKNHPILSEHVSAVFELEKRFFAQPDHVKLQAPYTPAHNAGFKPAHSHSSAGYIKKPDPREAFSINKWPTFTSSEAAILPPVLSENRPMIRSFQSELHAFALSLLECIALALELPPSTFTTQHERDKPNFDNFELMHYPALPPSTASHVPQNRISPHTDWGSITLLFQRDIGGLQVRPPRYTDPTLAEDEEWTPAPVFNDLVLVNIGDMMEFWTAGRLKSTWHRVTSNVVSNPEHGYADRYCFAYFLHPNKDAVLVPMEGMRVSGWQPRYEGEGRTAEEHIRARIGGVHSAVKDEAVQGMKGESYAKAVKVR